MDTTTISNTDIWNGVAGWFVTIFQIFLNGLVLVFSQGMTAVFTALFSGLSGASTGG